MDPIPATEVPIESPKPPPRPELHVVVCRYGDTAIDHQYLRLDNKRNEYRVCDLHGGTLIESLAAACVAVSK